MLTDSRIVLPRPTRPLTFTGLMTLYESNYVRLGWLLPDLQSLDAQRVSSPDADLPLHARLLERARYTTTIHLTYFFADESGRVADPDLTVRVYHDARLAEAMCCAGHHRHHALKDCVTPAGNELGLRWARNTMLNKWLEYCVDLGHELGPNTEIHALSA